MPDHLKFGDHLTSSAHDNAIRRTFIGQAHVAGTGPAGTTCRECRYFGFMKPSKLGGYGMCSPGYFAKKHKTLALTLKRGLCNRPIMNKAHRRIPHDALSCRLFEAADAPFPAVKPAEAVS